MKIPRTAVGLIILLIIIIPFIVLSATDRTYNDGLQDGLKIAKTRDSIEAISPDFKIKDTTINRIIYQDSIYGEIMVITTDLKFKEADKLIRHIYPNGGSLKVITYVTTKYKD